MNLMTDSKDNVILYYDFIGRFGYLAQLFEHKDVYLCQKIQSINIPASMIELESFRSSSKTTFVCKNLMVDLNNTIKLANYNKEQQFGLTDISSTINSPYSPPHNVKPVYVYLSTSNTNKGRRSAFEEDL